MRGRVGGVEGWNYLQLSGNVSKFQPNFDRLLGHNLATNLVKLVSGGLGLFLVEYA